MELKIVAQYEGKGYSLNWIYGAGARYIIIT